MLIQEEVKEIYVWEDVDIIKDGLLAEYPLTATSTYSDVSGNGYTLSETATNNSNKFKFQNLEGQSCAYSENASSTLTSTAYDTGLISLKGSGKKALTAMVWGNYISYSSTPSNAISIYNQNNYLVAGLGYKQESSTSYKAAIYLNTSGTQNPSSTQATLSAILSGWHLYTITIDDGVIKYYVDNLLKRGSDTLTYTPTELSIAIGRRIFTSSSTVGCASWIGGLSNCLVYDRALSLAEIRENYNTMKLMYGY